MLGNAFGIPGITVDTHFGRVARRLGWTEQTDAVKVESEVGALFPRKDWTNLSNVMVFHGRRMCHAKRPACGVPGGPPVPVLREGEIDATKARALLKFEMAPGREAEHAELVAAAGGDAARDE